MILITDSGSSKCDWLGYEKETKSTLFRTNTAGLNPVYLSEEQIWDIVSNSEELNEIRGKVTQVYFFGAGCEEVYFNQKIVKSLSKFFSNASLVVAEGDIAGAVYACTNEKGVVGILGTGSNICYYNEESIELRLPSLGYSIMDDGSGNAIGRRLLRAYYYGSMPKHLQELFEKEYETSPNIVNENIYLKQGASRYLASFAKFLFDHLPDPFLESILYDVLVDYFDNSATKFKTELKNHPFHFVGSIAYYSKFMLDSICTERGYTLGRVIQRPLEELPKRIDLFYK